MATAAPLVLEDADVADAAPADDAGPLDLIRELAESTEDLTPLLGEDTLTSIGQDVVRDYERDCADRHDWEEKARKGLDRASQEQRELENPPPYRRSNVDYPILTVAAMQFNARAYPAICKPGNMVRCQVIGSDKGRPKTVQTPQGSFPLFLLNGQPVPPGTEGAQPQWILAPGAKQARADRVADYLNVYLEFRMEDWEVDTDFLLMQIPIVGCGFRKLWWQTGKQCSAYVSALDIIVPVSAKSLKTTPRITERLNDVYPYQIRQRMRVGEYRTVDLTPDSDDDEAGRLLLEQHRYLDLDEDGVDEPYIITVDKETGEVLRVVSNFGPDQVHLTDDGVVSHIDREAFYVKYSFLPDPKGGFYDRGFAHLTEQQNDVINAAINQMLDAGRAQIAGGGFISGGLRLQSNNRTERLLWEPGEYKVVNVASGDLRSGIYERTFPNPSPIVFNLLELMLGAAKELTSVKDIVTGDAPNTAPVGTTLALIEQGLQVFTAIYKRIYRALGEEFSIIYGNLGRFGDRAIAEDYENVLDDPEAVFEHDFSDSDMDIKPLADPTAVTSQQRLAKAQVLSGLKGQGLNDMEINRRILEAANIEDIDSLMPPENAPPNPLAIAELRVKTSQANLNDARAQQAGATAAKTGFEVGHQAGESAGYGGGIPDVAGGPGNAVGTGGAPGAGPGVSEPLGAGVVGAGGV